MAIAEYALSSSRMEAQWTGGIPPLLLEHLDDSQADRASITRLGASPRTQHPCASPGLSSGVS